MTKIKSPVKNFKGTAYGLSFSNGIAETDDKYLISRFKAKGYEILGVEPKEETEEEPKEEIESLEYDELQTMAKKLDIKANQSKDDLIAAIKEAKA